MTGRIKSGKIRHGRDDVKKAVISIFLESFDKLVLMKREIFLGHAKVSSNINFFKTSELSYVVNIWDKGVNRRFSIILTELDS